VGWGSTSTNDDAPDPSDYLLTTNFPFIDFNECLGKIVQLTADNICGGTESGGFSVVSRGLDIRTNFKFFQSITGPGIRSGDSGAGFVFKYKDRYYLPGLVSRKNIDATSFAVFTDMVTYLNWIVLYV